MKKILCLGLSTVMCLTMAMPAFAATDITLTDSTEAVVNDDLEYGADGEKGTDYFADETTNLWDAGALTEECRVYASQASSFTVTIPKEVTLDGETGTADYEVNVKGDISGDQHITVIPDASFAMAEVGGQKADITATVTQAETEWTYDEVNILDDTDALVGKTEAGSIEAPVTAGEWEGKFNFAITFEAVTP